MPRPVIHWECGRPPTRAELAAIQRGLQSGELRSGDHVRPSRVRRSRRRRNPMSSAEAAYTEFHWGKQPRRRRRTTMPSPLEVFELGKLRYAEYQTRKGDQSAIWCHDFGWPYPSLTGTADGRLGPILGGNARVTHRGIVG
jgi:hypothetical protein